MRMKCGACLIVVMLTGLTPAVAARQSTSTVVRSIQVVENGGITHVTIDANGPLPLPLSEPLKDPPRIYFDLPGVTHKVSATTVVQRGGVVSRVRVALRPEKVTRIVLDLSRLESYRVIADNHQAGQLRVLIGSESAIESAAATSGAIRSPVTPAPAKPSPTPAAPARTAGTPAPPVPAGTSMPTIVDAPVTAAPKPSPAIAPPSSGRNPVLSPEPPRPALPAQEVLAYRKQVFAELARMETLRVLIARIDAGENISADTLVPAAQEFTELRRTLEAVKPSVVLAVAHDLLMTSCTFGAMAARFGIDAAQGNQEARRSAASAAAGSLMLFDRACADLGGCRPR